MGNPSRPPRCLGFLRSDFPARKKNANPAWELRILTQALPIIGGTIEEAKHLPLATIYAAQHVHLVQMGHEVNFPAVIEARKEMTAKWMAGMLKKSKSGPIKGMLNLD